MQADHFLRRVSNAGGIDGRLLAVDFEPYGEPGGQYYYLTPTNAVLESFVESLRKRVGEHPIVLYAGPGFWDGGTEPSGSFDRYGADVAWTAQYLDMDIHVDPQVYYQNNKDWDGGPSFDPPWDKPWGDVQPWFWQFTSAGRVAGMNIDVNAYRGTEGQLRALAAGRMLPPLDDSRVAGDLPAGTPHEITPAMGDREGWAERTWRVVREIEHRFGVVCSTYNNHGTTGRSLGIDIWVAPFQQKANAAQKPSATRSRSGSRRTWAVWASITLFGGFGGTGCATTTETGLTIHHLASPRRRVGGHTVVRTSRPAGTRITSTYKYCRIIN
jgi:hypothetical protein